MPPPPASRLRAQRPHVASGGGGLQPAVQFRRHAPPAGCRSNAAATAAPAASATPGGAACVQPHGQRGVAIGVQRVAGLPGLPRGLHVRGHPGQHLGRADGLGHVVHAAGVEGGQHVFGVGEARHEDDGNVRRLGPGLEAARHFETVDAGHHRVQQHDVGVGLRGALQRAVAFGGHQHGVAGFVQRVVQHGQVVGHVVDDQHQARGTGLAKQGAGALWTLRRFRIGRGHLG
jgi:hypothetical protein